MRSREHRCERKIQGQEEVQEAMAEKHAGSLDKTLAHRQEPVIRGLHNRESIT
jgi:hypothetical protein